MQNDKIHSSSFIFKHLAKFDILTNIKLVKI